MTVAITEKCQKNHDRTEELLASPNLCRSDASFDRRLCRATETVPSAKQTSDEVASGTTVNSSLSAYSECVTCWCSGDA